MWFPSGAVRHAHGAAAFFQQLLSTFPVELLSVLAELILLQLRLDHQPVVELRIGSGVAADPGEQLGGGQILVP